MAAVSIAGFDDEQFRRKLRENLTSAKAIADPQHLRGRESKLRLIDRAFNSPGKHVFIFGDRGVGKTSLAQSAAVLHQSSDADPIVLACDHETNFFALVRDIAKRCVPAKEVVEKRQRQERAGLKLFGLSWDLAQSVEVGEVPSISTLNDAILIMRYLAQFHSKEPLVTIDEFDQIRDGNVRRHFADLIKQVSDQDVGVRFIFCGIGKSLDELLGVHLSTGRYISPIELERLSHDARWEIIRSAANELDITVPEEICIRIGQISDGYPYYVHLIAEMMFWAMFDDESLASSANYDHFKTGLDNAISEAQMSLKSAYDRATQKYKHTDEYEETLWAVADKPLLRRQIKEIYENSYLRIMEDRPWKEPLNMKSFYQRMHNLKTDRHGTILETTSAGWYQFKENVVRGDVRLRAENSGIQLDRDLL